MDELKKLKYNVKALLDHVESDNKFFSSIISFVYELNNPVNSKEIDVGKIDFFIEKIDGFYNKYRSDDGSYIPPSQISRSDSIVTDLREGISKLKQLSQEKLLSMNSSIQVSSPLGIHDKNLIEACQRTYDSEDWRNLVLNACRHLEVRIREKANLSQSDIGVDLVNKAFNKDTGKLKIPFCVTPAEEEGFFHVFRGIFLFHRNAKGHREGEIGKEIICKIFWTHSGEVDKVNITNANDLINLK